MIMVLVFGVASSCNLCGVSVTAEDVPAEDAAAGDQSDSLVPEDMQESTEYGEENAESEDSDVLDDAVAAEDAPAEDQGQQQDIDPGEQEDDVQQEQADEEGDAEEDPEQWRSGKESDPQIEGEPITVTFHAIPRESGFITDGGLVKIGEVFVGHLGGWDQEAVGYISFDISEISDIGSSLYTYNTPFGLSLPAYTKHKPLDGFNELYFCIVEYGESGLDAGINDLPDVMTVLSYPADFDCIDHGNEGVMYAVSKALNEGRKRVQFRIEFDDYSAYTDSDKTHGIRFNASDAKLIVTYHEL